MPIYQKSKLKRIKIMLSINIKNTVILKTPNIKQKQKKN